MTGWVDLPFWKSHTWDKIQEQIKDEDIQPRPENIFKSLTMTPLRHVKAVIIGQDPYPGGQAMGLAFGVHPFVQILPPSLKNIFREYCTDLGYPLPLCGDLSSWAKEGVLLLNTVLTCKYGQTNSHKHLGWQTLTRQMMEFVIKEHPYAVFICWGKEAEKAVAGLKITNLIKSPHPSPFAADSGFFGSRPFTKTNAMLAKFFLPQIDWRLP